MYRIIFLEQKQTVSTVAFEFEFLNESYIFCRLIISRLKSIYRKRAFGLELTKKKKV